MTDPISLPVFTEAQIGRILKKRVCARCYNDLVQMFAPERKYHALCPHCGEVWHGAHVSRRYAEELGQRALWELREVKQNLSDLYQAIPKPDWQNRLNEMPADEFLAALYA